MQSLLSDKPKPSDVDLKEKYGHELRSNLRTLIALRERLLQIQDREVDADEIDIQKYDRILDWFDDFTK